MTEQAGAPSSLSGQVVLITGAGHGLGRAQALAFARSGANVVVNSLNPDNANAVVAEIRTHGGMAVAYGSPVGTRAAGRDMVNVALSEFGDLHAIVNNAGVIRNGYFEDQTSETLTLQYEAHIAGPFFVTQAAWPVFRDRGYGRVVMTGSSAMFGMTGAASYAATKAGVVGLARALAVEGRAHGIAVNVLLPHAATDIRARNLAVDDDPTRPRSADAASAAHTASFPPGLRESLAKLRLPEAVTPMAMYLASTECAYSGETFVAGCGRFAHVRFTETHGWAADPGSDITVGDVANHLEEITDDGASITPGCVHDEIEYMARIVGAWNGIETRSGAPPGAPSV